MGISVSKSPLERRKSVIRRSQKRSIIQTIGQIEKLQKEIRRFKGVEEDENYSHLQSKIEHYTRDVSRKSNDVVPELRALHAKAVEMLSQAEQLLVTRLQDNITRSTEKKTKKEKCKDKENKEEADDDERERKESTAEDPEDMYEVSIEHLELQRDGAVSPLSNISSLTEQNSLISSTNKRKTVELNSIRIEPLEETVTQLEASPQQKRKSILKYGIQVLPDVNNQISPRQSANRPSVVPSSPKDHGVEFSPEEDNKLMETIKFEVMETEEEISQFEGKKNGMKYNKLKERLFCNLDQLSQVHNKSDTGYVQLKRFIESCLSFLDEKAENNNDDEVFLPNTPNTPNTPISPNGFKITYI